MKNCTDLKFFILAIDKKTMNNPFFLKKQKWERD
jgi:hypothetical protein